MPKGGPGGQHGILAFLDSTPSPYLPSSKDVGWGMGCEPVRAACVKERWADLGALEGSARGSGPGLCCPPGIAEFAGSMWALPEQAKLPPGPSGAEESH